MNRIISFILALIIIFNTLITAYADDYYTALEEQQKDEPYYKYGLWITGKHFNNAYGYMHNQGTKVSGVITYEYLKDNMYKNMPELRAEKILNGRYAFVEGTTRFWNSTSVEEMSSPAKVENNTFYIPAAEAEQLFGIVETNDYVSAENIEKATGLETFYDSRGLLLVGENCAEAIDTSSENATSEIPYNSFLDIDSCIGLIAWENVDFTDEEFTSAEKRLIELETVKFGEENKFSLYITDIIEDALEYLHSVNYNDPVSSPFSDINIVDYDNQQAGQNEIGECFNRILAMAKGYNLAVRTNYDVVMTEELKTAVLYAFNFIMEKHYCNNVYPGNGGQFPHFGFLWKYNVAKIIALMGDSLSDEKRIEYASEAWSRTQIPVIMNSTEFSETTFTNRLWLLTSALQLAIILKDSGRANFVLRNMNSCFNYYKTEKTNSSLPAPTDGFFDDGSFVYHEGNAYNLGYGESFMNNLAYTCALTEGSQLDLRNIKNFDNVYEIIKNNYLPFLYDNYKLHIVQGREVPYNFRAVMAAMLIIASGADDETKELLAPYFKDAISSFYAFRAKVYYGNGTPDYPFTNEYISNYLDMIENTQSADANYLKVFYKMDKAVQKTNDYVAALSFSSERTSKYESENSYSYRYSCQNWYVSDGMIYIYKEDDNNFREKWFDGQDPYYMPGTTVDSVERDPEFRTMASSISHIWGKGENSWAGGVTDGKTGVVGMTAGNKWVTGLDYKKSYFVFDDKIICLGSGITAGQGKMGATAGNVYTTVDNRLLEKMNTEKDQKYGYDDVYVDGKLLDVSFDEEMNFTDVKWSWTEGNNGYVYFGENDLTFKRVLHDVKYKRYGRQNEGDDKYTFMQTVLNHGENPSGESYAYVMLPNKTMDETEKYSENPDFEIIMQSDYVHAVRDKRTDAVYANVFKACELEGLKILTPCSLIIKTDGEQYEIYAADPTNSLDSISIKTDIRHEFYDSVGAKIENGIVTAEFDAYGKTVVFTAKVREINDPEFKIAANYTESKGENQEFYLILVAYENERLVGLSVSDKYFIEKFQENVPVSCSYTIAEDVDFENLYFKAFIWNDIGNMTPFGDYYLNINENGIIKIK